MQELRRLFIQCKDLKTLTISTLVTSRRESKRAKAHRDWSHLALRKPATSRPVDGRYGSHRFSSKFRPGAFAIVPPMQLKEGSLSLRRCGPTSHESLCQRWPPYLPATGRLVAGFRRAKCHHLVRFSTLVSSPNVTMEQKLFSFLNPLQWIEASVVISKHKQISSRCSRYFFPAAERLPMDPLKSPILIVLLIAVVVAVLAAIGYIVTHW